MDYKTWMLLGLSGFIVLALAVGLTLTFLSWMAQRRQQKEYERTYLSKQARH